MSGPAKPQFPAEQSGDGSFKRQEDAFREPFSAEAGRYHLYVSWACPWASRTIIVRKLKGLEEAIGMTAVDPVRDERGWAFRDGPGYSRDPINGFQFLSEAYKATDPNYRGRVTVPVLWDTRSRRIVNNSDDDIMRTFETGFELLAKNHIDLYPAAYRAEIDALNELIYETVNNGVYGTGFATSQRVYEEAAYRVFNTLDELEKLFAKRRYLISAHPVETDWKLFVTLIRFDTVYYGHFKCNLRRIVDYPNLWGYLRDLYHIEGIAETVNFDHIKRHYYMTHEEINPTRIVPIGPLLDMTLPHGREHLP